MVLGFWLGLNHDNHNLHMCNAVYWLSGTALPIKLLLFLFTKYMFVFDDVLKGAH